MFHLVVNLLTSTAVLVHSLVGCGWHHGHEHVANVRHTVEDVHSQRQDHLDHGHPHSTERADAENGCPHPHDGPGEPCDEERCTYVTTGKVRLPDVELVASLAVVGSDVALESRLHSAATPPHVPVMRHGWATARLATQVWLL